MSLASSEAPSRARAWLLACRPATLTASMAPVVVGTACAAFFGGVEVAAALAAFAGAVLIQIGTNLANDLFDFEKGADTAARVGPTRVVQAGLLPAASVRRAMLGAFALSAVFGAYLVVVGGWPIALVGLCSIASGVAYTGGPWPLGYHGLGDPFVFVFFGVVAVCGTTFVQLGALPGLAVFASLGVGALSTAVLVVNNLRDRFTDREAGKRTLAVRFGRRFALVEYAGLVVLAHGMTPLVAWVAGSPWPLLGLATAPVGLACIRRVAALDGRALNPWLGATARLLLAHAALLSAGLVLARAAA